MPNPTKTAAAQHSIATLTKQKGKSSALAMRCSMAGEWAEKALSSRFNFESRKPWDCSSTWGM